MPTSQETPELSIITPAHDEIDNVAPLVEEIVSVMDETSTSYEIIVIDDASTDGTGDTLAGLLSLQPRLRALQLPTREGGAGHGQSVAFLEGIRHARGELVAMIDADRQNDPRDLRPMLDLLHDTGADMIQGDRTAARTDTFVRRGSSVVGRFFRRCLLNDACRDTGCSLRIMRRSVADALPLEYRGMHRFIPVTARQLGFEVIEFPVSHRPRTTGRSKYGILNRALPGLVDCLGVRWLRSRRCTVTSRVLDRERVAACRP